MEEKQASCYVFENTFLTITNMHLEPHVPDRGCDRSTAKGFGVTRWQYFTLNHKQHVLIWLILHMCPNLSVVRELLI